MEREHVILKLARATFGRVLARKYKLVLKNEKNIDLSTGPVLLFSNHVGLFDPMEISFCIKQRPVHWVAGAHLFRKNAFMKWLFTKVIDAIPKQQGLSDISTLRNMKRHLEEGHIVGIFPEGTRTWDGNMMKVKYSGVAKMAKKFNARVVFVALEGGFAKEPRWADHKRKGSVCVHIVNEITQETMQNMSLEEISTEIEKNLGFSNDEWKKIVDYKYESKARAEGIQRVLYRCPECQSLDSFVSYGNKFVCSNCHMTGILTEKDDINGFGDALGTISAWHEWEKETLSSEEDFPEEIGVLFESANPDNINAVKVLSKKIFVSLKKNILVVRDVLTNRIWEFPLNEISSLILNLKQTMEFVFNNTLYRVRLLADGCSLKYFDKFNLYKATEAK